MTKSTKGTICEYLSTLSPLQAGKAKKILLVKYCYSGEVMTEMEFVEKNLKGEVRQKKI